MKFNNLILLCFLFCLWGVLLGKENKLTEEEGKVRLQVQELIEKGKTAEAIQVIDDYEKKVNGEINVNFYEVRGSLWANQEDFKKAIVDYTKAYRVQKTYENVTGLAYSYLMLEDAINAESLFREGLLLFDNPMHFRKGLLQTFLMQERYKEALALVEALLKEKPVDAELLSLAGQIYRQMNEPDKAWESLKILEYAGQAKKKDYEILFDIALEKKLYQETKRLADLVSAKEGGLSTTRLYNFVITLLQNDLTDEAEKWIQKGAKGARTDRLNIYLAEALRLKDAEKSLVLLKNIKDPEVMDGRYYLLLGDLVLRQEKDTSQAKSIFREAASFEPYRKSALWQLFSLARTEKNAKECIKILNDLLEIDPENSSVQKFLEYFRAQSQ